MQNQNYPPGSQQVMVPESGRTLLARYGSRPEIREFAERIANALVVRLEGSETRRFTKAESVYLAEASLAHGLDPFVGQIYLLVVKNIPSIHVGPSGYEVQATRQLKNEGGGNWWPEFERIDSEQERADLLVPKAAIAYRCKLYDSPTIRIWTSAIDSMSRAGAEWREIMDILGKKPYVEGLGWYVPKGTRQDDMYAPHERARKRAFHAALKKRFALEMDGESDGDLAPDFTGPMRGDGLPMHEQEPSGDSGQGGAPAGEASGQTVEGTARATAAPASATPASGTTPMGVADEGPDGPPEAPPMDHAAMDAEALRQDAAPHKPLVARPGTRRPVGQATQASSRIPGQPAARDERGRQALHGTDADNA